MMVLITYDINTTTAAGRKRLQKTARVCLSHGQRVQNSVFECLVDPSQWIKLRDKLIGIINKKEDSLRFYFLGSNWNRRVEHVGAKESYNPEGPILI